MMRDGVPFIRFAETVLDHSIPNYQAVIMHRLMHEHEDALMDDWWGTEGRRH